MNLLIAFLAVTALCDEPGHRWSVSSTQQRLIRAQCPLVKRTPPGPPRNHPPLAILREPLLLYAISRQQPHWSPRRRVTACQADTHPETTMVSPCRNLLR
ncbi:hypothetical protein BC830DRAFT_1093094 [Chytriomyces sp. MP71]|nr:hypothetical protein BC830DRAFT_1093094 [Chytriomyces sp. MP71]